MSAIGRPKRVTRTGLRVRRTSSSTARQVALNFDMAISCTTLSYTMVNNHGLIKWFAREMESKGHVIFALKIDESQVREPLLTMRSRRYAGLRRAPLRCQAGTARRGNTETRI
jgi:hypothetical protein